MQLSPSSPLSKAPKAVFQIWRNREQIEIEAAIIFKQLADDMNSVWGLNDQVAELSRTASSDELRHAVRCQEILSHDDSIDYEPLVANYKINFGPQDLSLADRVLYTAVGVGCITETLSTALLLEMNKRAAPGIIKNTVHEILTDEVMHGRIGWAELTRYSKKRNPAWLSKHIPKLVEEAFSADISPMLKEGDDLSEWGILTPEQSSPIMEETLEKVIYPALSQFGIHSN